MYYSFVMSYLCTRRCVVMCCKNVRGVSCRTFVQGTTGENTDVRVCVCDVRGYAGVRMCVCVFVVSGYVTPLCRVITFVQGDMLICIVRIQEGAVIVIPSYKGPTGENTVPRRLSASNLEVSWEKAEKKAAPDIETLGDIETKRHGDKVECGK